MCDSQGTTHDDVVLELVRSSLLQPACRAGLHDFAHVDCELADAGSHLACANADDHALGVFGVGMARFVLLGVVRPEMGSLLGSSARHGEELMIVQEKLFRPGFIQSLCLVSSRCRQRKKSSGAGDKR